MKGHPLTPPILTTTFYSTLTEGTLPATNQFFTHPPLKIKYYYIITSSLNQIGCISWLITLKRRTSMDQL